MRCADDHRRPQQRSIELAATVAFWQSAALVNSRGRAESDLATLPGHEDERHVEFDGLLARLRLLARGKEAMSNAPPANLRLVGWLKSAGSSLRLSVHRF